MMHKKSSGMIVVFALMVLSIIILLTEQLLRSVRVGTGFINTMVQREHAEILALGGINLAVAQLSVNKSDPAKKQKKSSTDQSDKKGMPTAPTSSEGEEAQKLTPMQQFIGMLLPNLNRWQTFQLTSKADGMEGQVKICVVSEHGKINLNRIFDFQKQEMKKEYEFLLKGLEIPGRVPLGELYNRIFEFLKKRGKPLYDVSELMAISGIDTLDIFYHPPEIVGKKKEGIVNNVLTLQDIFTLWTTDEKLHPLLLSDSMCMIFGLRRPHADDAQRLKDRFKQVAAAFKPDWGSNWEANWKFLDPLYEQKPKLLKELTPLFSKKFSPKVYSVLSYGKVGQVEQRVLAIIKEINENQIEHNNEERVQDDQKQPKPNKESSKEKQDKKNQKKKTFKIVRLYWL